MLLESLQRFLDIEILFLFWLYTVRCTIVLILFNLIWFDLLLE